MNTFINVLSSDLSSGQNEESWLCLPRLSLHGFCNPHNPISYHYYAFPAPPGAPRHSSGIDTLLPTIENLSAMPRGIPN